MRRLAPLLVAAALVAGCSSAAGHRSAAPPSASATAAAATTAPATAAPATAAPASSAPATSNSSTPAPCRGSTPPAQWDHVVVIVMENRALDEVAGSGSAPYAAHLARICASASGYSGVAHPSLPNYIALTSGSTHGISDDAGPGSHPIPGPSIFSLLGTGWRTLAESMPSPCERSGGGEYATKHNPAVYYTSLAGSCPAQDVPLDAVAPDLSARFTLIIPNLCHDGHDCSTATADRWLSAEVPRMIASPEYRAGRTAVLITWDENDEGGTLVPTYVIAPSVRPGTVVSARLDHYAMLRAIESMLGLSPLLGAAATAPDLRGPFHL